MWISKKKWQNLEKRVAALERENQSHRMLAPRVKVEVPNKKVAFDGAQFSKAIAQALSEVIRSDITDAAHRYAVLRDGWPDDKAGK